MSDPLENYVRGQPLSFRADTLNAWNEAARRTRGEKYDGGALAALDDIFPCLTVIVRNDTGSDLPARSVVYLSDWVVSPVTFPFEAQARPVLKAIAPTATTVRVGILRDAIPDGEMGRAIVQGVAVVDVVYVADGLPCATPAVGVTASLTQAKVGQAKIIQYETSGATRRALVLLIGQPDAITDFSGRSGSIADVTALQILRGVISGTPGAAVFTPDDASVSLPGDVNLSAQAFLSKKTFTANGDLCIVSSTSSSTDRTAGFDNDIYVSNRADYSNPSMAGFGLAIHNETSNIYVGLTDSAPESAVKMFLTRGTVPNPGVVSFADDNARGCHLECNTITADANVIGNQVAAADAVGGGYTCGVAIGQSFTDVNGTSFTRGIATTAGGSNLSVPGSAAFTGDISPSQLTANTNDWNPTGW